MRSSTSCDRARRSAAIARIYADDIRWTDDDGVTTGRAALDAKAVELQAKLGDLQFIAAGPSYQTLGLGYLAFNVVKPGSDAPQSSGFDVAIVRGGVIAELYTVLTDQPRVKRRGCSRRRPELAQPLRFQLTSQSNMELAKGDKPLPPGR